MKVKNSNAQDHLAQAIERERAELTGYLKRMVTRLAVAEELMQETALRAWQHRENAPPGTELRPWLFRIATNLAIDYLRKQGTRSETLLLDAQTAAESSPSFATRAASLRGQPEYAAIAREHLVACFACTLGQFPPELAATLLLREVYGFSTDEIARILEARFAQVKHWLQQARAGMNARYARTCALIHKQGVCYQCVELAEMFGGNSENPLAGTAGSIDDRLRIMREMRSAPVGSWERILAKLLDEIGG